MPVHDPPPDRPRHQHETRGPLYLGAACYLGDELTIYPYTPETIGSVASSGSAASLQPPSTPRP